MPGATSRLDLPYPLGTEDAADGNDVIQDLAEALDQTVLYDQGALSTIQTGGAWESSVGTPGVAGRLFLVTSGYGSVPLRFRDTGTGWVPETMPSFAARAANSTGTISGSLSKIAFATEERDDAGWYDTATSRFNPKIAGPYRISAQVMMPVATSGSFGLAVYKNGAVLRWLADATAQAAVSGTTTVEANGSTDYFEIWAVVSAGGPLTYYGLDGSGRTSRFEGELIRPS